jgi:hypothetical protein
MQTLDELERFLRELRHPAEGEYSGITLRTANVDPMRLGRAEHAGIYLRLVIEPSLCLDLRLQNRDRRLITRRAGDAQRGAPYRGTISSTEQVEELREAFSWSATSDQSVLELLRGPHGEALLSLAERHQITLRDSYLQYGPLGNAQFALFREPRVEAELLALATRALPRTRNLARAELRHACPACQTPIGPDQRSCPDCGLAL